MKRGKEVCVVCGKRDSEVDDMKLMRRSRRDGTLYIPVGWPLGLDRNVNHMCLKRADDDVRARTSGWLVWGGVEMGSKAIGVIDSTPTPPLSIVTLRHRLP